MIRALILSLFFSAPVHANPFLDQFGPVDGYIPSTDVQTVMDALGENLTDEDLMLLYFQETYCSPDWWHYKANYLTHGLEHGQPNELRAGFPVHAASIGDFDTCLAALWVNVSALRMYDGTKIVEVIEQNAAANIPLLE